MPRLASDTAQATVESRTRIHIHGQFHSSGFGLRNEKQNKKKHFDCQKLSKRFGL